MLTVKQADKLIDQKQERTFHNAKYQETFNALLVSRDCWNVTSSTGQVYSRDEITLVEVAK